MRCIYRPLDIFGLGSRDLADDLPGRWRDIVKIPTLCGRNPFAADKVLVPGAQGNLPFDSLQVGRERATLVN
jgi:hypothetical protein